MKPRCSEIFAILIEYYAYRRSLPKKDRRGHSNIIIVLQRVKDLEIARDKHDQ